MPETLHCITGSGQKTVLSTEAPIHRKHEEKNDLTVLTLAENGLQ